MSERDAQFWARVRRARDKLVDRYIGHPDVTAIDIGYAPGRGRLSEEIVLRIFVRERWFKASPQRRVTLPDQVEGVRVIVQARESHFQDSAGHSG